MIDLVHQRRDRSITKRIPANARHLPGGADVAGLEHVLPRSANQNLAIQRSHAPEVEILEVLLDPALRQLAGVRSSPRVAKDADRRDLAITAINEFV